MFVSIHTNETSIIVISYTCACPAVTRLNVRNETHLVELVNNEHCIDVPNMLERSVSQDVLLPFIKV